MNSSSWQKKSIHCSQGNNEVAHASQQLRAVSARAVPSLPTSWAEEKPTLSASKKAEEKWGWKATLTGCTVRYLRGLCRGSLVFQ